MLEENRLASLPQAPEKMVSINDNVEEIILPSKMKKMSKSLKKINSISVDGGWPGGGCSLWTKFALHRG